MSKKEKEIQLIAATMKGSRVKIFTETCGHLFTGEIIRCVGSFIEFKNVEWHNGNKISEETYHSQRISKIEPA